MGLVTILLAFVAWTLMGMAGLQIGKIKGYDPVMAFWLCFIFGPFGLIYVSTGTAEDVLSE